MTNTELDNKDIKETKAFTNVSAHNYIEFLKEKNKLNNQINEICQNNNSQDATNKLLAIMINELFDLKNEVKINRRKNTLNFRSINRIQLSLNEIGNKMSDTLDTIQLLQ